MRIVDNSRVYGAGNRRRTDKASSHGTASFASHLGAASAPSSEVSDTGGLAGAAPVDGLLALQDQAFVDERPGAVQRGYGMLDRLDDLRLALLDGRSEQALLRDIEHLIDERATRGEDDPRLQTAIREIEVRAAVELAKLEKK